MYTHLLHEDDTVWYGCSIRWTVCNSVSTCTHTLLTGCRVADDPAEALGETVQWGSQHPVCVWGRKMEEKHDEASNFQEEKLVIPQYHRDNYNKQQYNYH